MARSQTKPQAQDDEWSEEVGGGRLIKWDAPIVVIGTYESREMAEGRYGLKPRVTLVTPEGETVAFFPPSMLDSRLQQVSFGQKVRIEYDGSTTLSKSGQPVKNFSVRVARDAAAAAAETFGGAGSGVRV